MNRFLNKALVNSKPQNTKTASNLARSRVEMDYAHTYETDTFYTLSQAGILTLPKSIRSQINPRDKKGQSVRVTTNNKTGQLIAQIIKVRVANLEIYSPGTLFDWRISVNVEMKIEGDFRQLIEPGDAGKTKAPRNKDRLSYKHSQYQIDLTQVTEADVSGLRCSLDSFLCKRAKLYTRHRRNTSLKSKSRARKFGHKVNSPSMVSPTNTKNSSRALSTMSEFWYGIASLSNRIPRLNILIVGGLAELAGTTEQQASTVMSFHPSFHPYFLAAGRFYFGFGESAFSILLSQA